MNHQGLRRNVPCVANVGLRIRLNLYKRGFKIYDLLVHVRFEGNNKYAKKVLSQPWNSLTLQISLSLREKHDKIVFTLQGYFGRSDNLLRSPRIFVILDKRSELSGCFLFKRLQRSEGILIIFELIPSKELVFRVERPRPPLGRITRPEMLIRQKLLKHGYKDSVTNIIFFIVCEIYFILVLWKLSIRRE